MNQWAVSNSELLSVGLDSQLDTLLSGWPVGLSFTVEKALDRSPDLRSYPHVLVELAFEEYCYQLKGNPELNAVDFAKKFPQIGSILVDVITAVETLENKRRIDFPGIGENYLGYQLDEIIGESHLSRVYIACQTEFANRRVVLKLSRSIVTEINHLAEISHPNIIFPLTSHYDSEQSMWAICMPYEGSLTFEALCKRWFARKQSIHDLLAFDDIIERKYFDNDELNESGLSISHKLSYAEFVYQQFLEISYALEYVHQRGIIHSDIKPSNLLINNHGVPKLFDFNLAVKSEQSKACQPRGGTNLYASPELIVGLMTGGSIDCRSDIYSLGMSLLTSLVEPPPDHFESSSYSVVESLQDSVLIKKYLLQRLNEKKVPSSIELIIRKCLENDPSHRYQSARNLSSAIQNAIHSITSKRRRRRFFLNLFLLVPLGGGGYGALQYYNRTALRVDRAFAKYDAGQYQDSLYDFQQIYRRDSSCIAAEICASFLYLKCDNAEIGYRDLDKLNSKLDTGMTNSLVGYAALLAELPEKATLHFLNRAIALGGNSPENLINSAYCLERLGRFDEALLALDQADLSSGIRIWQSHATRLVIELRTAIKDGFREPSASLLSSLDISNAGTSELFHIAKFLAYASRFDKNYQGRVHSLGVKLKQAGVPPQQLDSIFSLNPEIKNDFPSTLASKKLPIAQAIEKRICCPISDIRELWFAFIAPANLSK